MKSPALLSLSLLLVTILVLGACVAPPAPTEAPAPAAAATEVPATEVPPTEVTAAEPMLEINGPSGLLTLTLDDLTQLDVVEGEAGQKSSTGKITPPVPHRGVSLLTLAELAGPLTEEMGVNVVAKDGYAITFSYDQLKNGTFIAYDPATGEELAEPGELTAILAFERDGQSLPADSDGTLRVVIISPKRDQVTDGHWSVKWVNKIEIRGLVADWNLSLDGGIDATLDPATFESCVGCHKATWTDDMAQVWTGVPLWYLMGYADDEVKHQGPAFNEALALAGYMVEPVAADGYSVSLESAPLARNNDVIVAALVNDTPLPEKYFPLRLVGPTLKKNEMVGALAEIKLAVEDVAAEPAAEPTVEPTADPTAVPAAAPADITGDLVIIGAVGSPLGLAMADLQGLEVVKLTLEHPKKGPAEYEGVRLSEVLALAKPAAAASAIVFTASDGFTAEASLADVQACADCLVAFDPEGTLNLAMPSLASNLWVKDVTAIELK